MSAITQQEGKTIKCPFDPSHVMPYDRFLNHLEKCKFADKKSYLKCKYNPYHVIHQDLIASHESKCQDRTKFQEDSDDDWGVEHEKPEKSTVSTSVTAKLSSCASKQEEKTQKRPDLHNNSRFFAESFDDYDFKSNSKRR